ncbi:SpoIID/LytB domain-containing protein [Eubacterium sp. MSJ-13]|uniref:SpoIID/LytB domain-containing protein n=1 Tax=Eubacterium sp. MSJ-13 TaxID=2841513 RepID=UPI001C12771C|nr:SpoIID/LytB domain-containing protein [Eubacterium sp. MSJ-13]MBU5479286.1 SpoIID/LytB domain-containing protein [Eubacterium sp. MSJ-13]
MKKNNKGKTDNKKQMLIIIAVISIMVFVCIVLQAYMEGYFGDRKKDDTAVLNEKTDVKEDKADDVTPAVTKEPEKKVKATSKKKVQKKKVKKKAKTKTKTVHIAAAPESSKPIRVLITNSDFSDMFHQNIKVTSSKSFYVKTGNKTKSYPAGKKVEFKASDKKLKGKKIIIGSYSGARIRVLNIKRLEEHPQYRGTMTVKYSSKGLLLTNTLPIEQYLYAVIPSEMSTGNNIEALKAQAVCARSYAYNQMKAKKYEEYGADVDDSVACQVYNNIPENEKSRKAVDATFGDVMKKSGNVITAYYFSTSWGYTADGQDVWNTPSKISYLGSRFQITQRSKRKTGISGYDLSNESTFRNFINSDTCNTYDSKEEWYRWSVKIKEKSLRNRIDSALSSCYLSNNSYVLTKTKNGEYKKKAVFKTGKINDIIINKREKSGIVSEIIIKGNKNTYKVCNQYNIRKVLAPVYETIKRRYGGNMNGYFMLPSAAFYIDKTSGGFSITGGGFGHGTGMSQSGAGNMAKQGFNYSQILRHYFSGVKIVTLKDY